jgi:hypothetical protein
MKILYFILLSMLSVTAYTQGSMDTIFTYNSQVLGKVKEVTILEIAYSLPNEDVTYRIPKYVVLRIAYSSGRNETFSTTTSYPRIESSNDWRKVGLTANPADIMGMSKISFVTSKAKALTFVSSVSKIQETALRKFKQAAAMLGGAIVLVHNQTVEGNIFLLRSARVQFTGTAYMAQPQDTASIRRDLSNKRFKPYFKRVLRAHARTISGDFADKLLEVKFGELNNLDVRNGVVSLKFDINENVDDFAVKDFILTHHDANSFTVAYQHNLRFVEIVFRQAKD